MEHMAGSRQQFLARGDFDEGLERRTGRDPFADPDAGEEPCEGAKERLAHVVDTIEAEIIPRLVLAHRAAPESHLTLVHSECRPRPEDVTALARIALTGDAAAAVAAIEVHRAQGMALEVVFLELLAPAARHLGGLWDDDLVDFASVTLGLFRLQQVLREYAPAFRHDRDRPTDGRRVLLGPVPGEQHTFGVFMVAEFFRHAGWDVWDGPLASADALLQRVASDWFAVVGLSLSGETRLDVLATSIRGIRRVSQNRDVGVMVGGPMILARPELVALVGADATAVDARQACLQAEHLLELLARRA